MSIILSIISVLAIIVAYEIGKVIAKRLFWKTASAKVPNGSISFSVRRFGSQVEPEEQIDNYMQAAGLHRVE